MKKLFILLFFSVFCFADTIYYANDMVLTNCKVIENNNSYTVQAFTKSGISEMEISKAQVKMIEFSPVDSSAYSQMNSLIKGERVNITEMNEERIKKIIEEERTTKEITSDVEKKRKEYEIRTNIPLLATGTVFSTMGVINLIDVFNLNKNILETEDLIDEYPELEEFYEETYLSILKRSRKRSIIYSTIFTVAGAINIYFSFEKVSIDASPNELNLSYSF